MAEVQPDPERVEELMAGIDGVRPLEDLPTPEYTFAEIKAAALGMAERARAEAIEQVESADRHLAAAIAAHDAAVGLPGFVRVTRPPARGTLEWAEQVLHNGQRKAAPNVQAASAELMIRLAEVVEHHQSAPATTLVADTARKLLSQEPQAAELVDALRELRRRDGLVSEMCDELDATGMANSKEGEARDDAADQARDVLYLALRLLGVTQ